MAVKKRKETNWWNEFFPTARPIFSVVSTKATSQQVRYIAKMLDLKSGRSFLDCPCGIGRIALPLARKGVKVTGVDIIPSYLEELKTKADRRKLKIELHEKDMRRIDFRNRFDAAGNLWTSFGYFDKESDNRLVLKKIFQALKPSGRFLLHVINRDWILTNFQSSDWIQVGKIKILEERGFDYAKSSSTTRWHFIGNGKEAACDTAIRMYSYHELIALFKSVGFIEIEGFGSVKGEKISHNSRMIWLFGSKPGR